MTFPLEKLAGLLEIALCDSKAGLEAHRGLFHFSDRGYMRVCGGDIVLDVEGCSLDDDGDAFAAIAATVTAYNSATAPCPTRLHLVLNWENVLRVAAWRPGEMKIWDALEVLRKAGVREGDLKPFSTSSVGDMFPSLYYGRQFDILRRVCHAARRQVESHIKCRNVRIDCHMFDATTQKMVSSSL